MAPAVNIHAESGSFPPKHTQNQSHFTVSQDPGAIKPSMHSIFKTDYPPHPRYGRADLATKPNLGQIMHKDDSLINEKTSETKQCFEYRYLKNPVLMNIHSKMNATNFKMDRDTNKFKCFKTTHDDFFTPQMSENYKRVHPTLDVTTTHVPQGDEKAILPLSDYKDRFQGHDVLQHPLEKAPAMHQGGPPTITGDKRMSGYITSTNDQFPGTWQPRSKPFPAPIGTNVPNGDPEKLVMGDTTMVNSFPHPGDSVDFKPYNQAEAFSKTQKTNLRQHDGRASWENYLSTSKIHFMPKELNYENVSPMTHRNHSDLPQGDRQPSRDAERMSLTTNRFYLGNPPRGLHNRIVSGAFLRTRSNVTFGDPALGHKYYSTSTDSVYDPKSVPYTYNRKKFHTPTNIPVKYYSSWEPEATTINDFQDPRQGRTIINEDALNTIRRSHIFPPLKDTMYLQTTHRDVYTPKTTDKYSYDAWRLQKSSVPLGTLS